MPTNEAVGLSQASVDDKLLGLLGPYHQHAIGMLNTVAEQTIQLKFLMGPDSFRIRILSISSRAFALKSRSNGHNQWINERIGTEKWEVQT
jgi:hypothetical protein